MRSMMLVAPGCRWLPTNPGRTWLDHLSGRLRQVFLGQRVRYGVRVTADLCPWLYLGLGAYRCCCPDETPEVWRNAATLWRALAGNALNRTGHTCGTCHYRRAASRWLWLGWSWCVACGVRSWCAHGVFNHNKEEAQGAQVAARCKSTQIPANTAPWRPPGHPAPSRSPFVPS